MDFSSDRKAGKNSTGIIIVVLLDVLIAYGIVTGLGKRLVTKMAETVETRIVEEQAAPPPKEVPPPPPPEMKAPPPPFIPPVEVNVQPPPVQSPIAVASAAKPATTELARPQAPAPPAAAPAANPSPVRVAASADFNTCAKPDWPKASLRNEETGTVTLSFLIGVDGRVTDSKIVKSSGFRDLDKAAVAGISKCRFKPSLTDGKAEQAWMSMQYVWTLE